MRRIILTTIKAGLFVLLIYLLVRNVPVGEIPAALTLFHPFSLVVLIFLLLVRYILLGLRWHYACKVHGVNLPAAWFVRSEFEILFLEFTLPLPNAEDAFRILFLKTKQVAVATGMSVALLLRVCGLSIILVLLIGLLVKWGAVLPNTISGHITLITFLSIMVLLVILFHKRLMKKAAPLLLKLPRGGSRAATIVNEVAAMPIGLWQYTVVIVYSVLIFSSIAFYLYVLIADTGFMVSFIDLLLIVPLFMLSFLLPLSIQGLGLPEATLALVLPLFGVPEAVALAVATLHFAAFVLLILCGGILVWLSSGHKWKEIKLQLKEWRAGN